MCLGNLAPSALSSGMKECSTCHESQPLSDYYAAKTRDGVQNECKACTKRRSTANKRRRMGLAAGAPLPPKHCGDCGVPLVWRDNHDRTRYCPACRDARSRASTEAYEARRRAHPERFLPRNRNKRKHGLTLAQREELVLAAGGCQACRAPFTEARRPVIDHDHSCCPKTYSCGQCIRGVLCAQCNSAAGFVGDSPDRLRALANYLERA